MVIQMSFYFKYESLFFTVNYHSDIFFEKYVDKSKSEFKLVIFELLNFIF